MKTIILCFVSLVLTIGECTALCPGTWVSNHGSCYLFSNESKSFTESENFCVQENAHLVKVDSRQESLFLVSFSTKLKDGPRWIGLTDATIAGLWTWTDDSDISGTSFTDFHLGEANQYPSAHCAVVWVQHRNQWAVEPCSKAYRFICKKP